MSNDSIVLQAQLDELSRQMFDNIKAIRSLHEALYGMLDSIDEEYLTPEDMETFRDVKHKIQSFVNAGETKRIVTDY